MARLGRRQTFKPILSGLIQYLIGPIPPVASKQFVASFAAKNAGRSYRTQRPRVLLTGLIRYAPAVAAARLPIVFQVSRISVSRSSQRSIFNRTRVFRSGLIPTGIPIDQRFVTDIKIDHDETITSKQSRRHEQQVAKLLNALARKGQLRGTVVDPDLGYLADDPLQWGNDPPLTVGEALDRLSAETASSDLTGPISATGGVTSITSQTGTGTTFVMSESPTIVAADASSMALQVKAAPSQTEDIQQWQDENGDPFISVLSTGQLLINTLLADLDYASYAPLIVNNSEFGFAALFRNTSSDPGFNWGPIIEAGLVASDSSLYITSADATRSILDVKGDAQIHLYNANGDGSVHLKVSAAMSGFAFWTFTLPVNDGIMGQVLRTDGSGVTSWIAAVTCVADAYADVSTTHTDGTFDTLHTYTSPANTLATNGDKIDFDYTLTVVTHTTNTADFKLVFAGVTIFDSTAQTYAATGTVRIYGYITRATSTTCRATISFRPSGSATILGFSSENYVPEATLTGLTLTGTNTLVLSGAAAGVSAASGDIKLVQATIHIDGFGS